MIPSLIRSPGKTPRKRSLAALLSIAALTGSAVGQAQATPRPPVGTGPEIRINQDPDDVRQHYDLTLAVNPRNTSNFVVTNSHSTDDTCFIHTSFNAGKAWQSRRLDLAKGRSECGITDAAFDRHGILYVTYTAFVEEQSARKLFLARSVDGGRSIASTTDVGVEAVFSTAVGIDDSGGRRDGTLYIGYIPTSRPANRRATVIASRDGGKTFGEPVTVSPLTDQATGRVQLDVGPTGEVYVTFMDFTEQYGPIVACFVAAQQNDCPDTYGFSAHVAVSTDGAKTFADVEVDDQLGGGLIANFQTVIPFPVVAVDPNDGKRAHLAVTDRRRGGDWDLYYYRTTNGGKSWSEAQRLNDDPCKRRRDQVMPWIDVAPNGRVDVVWLDRREDSKNRRGRPYITSSFDGGTSWTPNRPISTRLFDTGIGSQGFGQTTYIGDRLALYSSNEGGHLAWPDTRNGNRVNGTSDLYSRRLELSKKQVPTTKLAARQC